MITGLSSVPVRVAFPLAGAGIDLFALSTLHTEYLLVKENDLGRAIEVLMSTGHVVLVWTVGARLGIAWSLEEPRMAARRSNRRQTRARPSRARSPSRNRHRSVPNPP